MANYSIKVLEIGFDKHFPTEIAFDSWHCNGETDYQAFSITLIQGEGHNILCDAGFDPASEFAKKRIAMEGDENCHNPAEVLGSIGLSPEDIDILILSHCHWDHINAVRYFANAKIYLQEAELRSWKDALKGSKIPSPTLSVIDSEALEALTVLVQKGAVTLLNGDVKNFLPGIDIICASGHSFVQNMLFLNSNSVHYAVIGDVSLRPQSFIGSNVFPGFLPNVKFAVGSVMDITASYQAILDWVNGKIENILMSHDGSRQDKSPTIRSSLGLNISTVCA